MCSHFHKLLICLPLAFIFFVFVAQESHGYAVEDEPKAKLSSSYISSVPAVIVFGDSTVDPGNNNFIKTVFKSNFPPYGVDFDGHDPTGRFTNGRLATDFVASYLGIKKYIPPYLDPNLSLNDMITGVSFASAGTGYDPVTSTTNGVISMSKQLEHFAEYKARLSRSIGIKRTMQIISKAIFVVSCGTNDFGQSQAPARKENEYEKYVLSLCKNFIQELLGHGAQNVVMLGLPPIGCLPSVITRNSAFVGPVGFRSCIESPSSVAMGYNRMLQGLLKSMKPSLGRRQVIYADIYTPLLDQIRRPDKYGFEVVNRGCCGTGLFEEGIICSAHPLICPDRSKFVFWDAIHPTETSYYYLFLALRPVIDIIAHNSVH